MYNKYATALYSYFSYIYYKPLWLSTIPLIIAAITRAPSQEDPPLVTAQYTLEESTD